MQDVGERLWRQPVAYDDVADLLPYARTVARNLHRDRLRQLRCHPAVSLTVLLDRPALDDVAEQTATQLELAAALAAVRLLSPDQQLALLDPAPAEAGGAARMQRARLRKRLRRAIATAGLLVVVVMLLGVASTAAARHRGSMPRSRPTLSLQHSRPIPGRQSAPS